MESNTTNAVSGSEDLAISIKDSGACSSEAVTSAHETMTHATIIGGIVIANAIRVDLRGTNRCSIASKITIGIASKTPNTSIPSNIQIVIDQPIL
jgi:ethanolamine utilization cobalamin adenosyltransferase